MTVNAFDLPTEQLLYEQLKHNCLMATREGARYLGIDAGVLAPGKLADIAIVDLERPHLRPLHRAVSALVYSARGSDVVTTIVGGEVVFDDGRCTTIDESTVMTEAQARADALIARAGLAGLVGQWRDRQGPDAGRTTG